MDARWSDALERGDASTLASLLEAGADVDARDRHGQTGLMRAAHAGHLAVVELLIRHGADLDVTAKYRLSAVMLAAIAGHEAIARRLAEAGADLTLRGSGAPGFAGKTAADLAREQGLTDLAEVLGGDR